MKKKDEKFIVNFDFASLYPSSITMKFGGKKLKRKLKIKKIFNE
jgi:hypothetical protein